MNLMRGVARHGEPLRAGLTSIRYADGLRWMCLQSQIEGSEFERRAWFRNVPSSLGKEDVASWLGKVGSVEKLLTKEDEKGGTRQVYAQFLSREDARKAVKALHGSTLKGLKVTAFLSLDQVQDFGAPNPLTSVEIDNLPWNIDQSAVKELLEDYGPVAKLTIKRVGTSSETGCTVVVELPSREKMQRACDELDLASKLGRTIRVQQAG